MGREPWFDARDLDPYTVPGHCWCADERTIRQLRAMGHDARCTQARRGWQANYRHLAALDRERREDERVGRELRLAGAANSQKAPS